jgi:hypothetical protein
MRRRAENSSRRLAHLAPPSKPKSIQTRRAHGARNLPSTSPASATGDAESLLLVCSGTHGNEGFCGSFCQTAFIEEGIIDAWRGAVAVLLVHAVNAYGFSHIRRVTENNVDLNRNFRDFAKPPPENPRYAEIHELLVPAD